MDNIKLQYSNNSVREAVRLYWYKQTGIVFPVLTIFLATYVSYLVINGNRSWFVGVLGTISLLAIVLIPSFYFIHLNRSLKQLKKMKKPEANLELTEDRLIMSSDLGKSEIDWSVIKKIWCFDNVWLLVFAAGEFVSLPIVNVNNEAREFMLLKARENGAEIA